ncbi:hypothetical protein HOLleu_40374 [Holothuria leucospilota]|uniref:SWIM-type domain-containing protein n=1 Tax=Holothuria leucospilota TaxID=206669 RepID=A0A9Q0YDJ1_HOLLE|nr:hypothetical protein HOLleu_40374 [Holothuria leucospilota]
MSDENDSLVLSDITNKLDNVHKERYVQKVQLTRGTEDPYLIPKSMFTDLAKTTAFPHLQYPDIYHYLVNKTSAYTHETLKNYKSLEAYKYFVAGFVREALVYKNPSNIFIITSKVLHSQRLSEAPLQAWVSVKENGEVICGHCSCMAGLGETCSHVAAILFALETSVRLHTGKTCTSVACSWLAPSTSKGVEYAEARNIEFHSAKSKLKESRRQLFQSVPGRRFMRNEVSKRPYNANDHRTLYDSLFKASKQCAILSVVEPYAEEFVPAASKLNLPSSLTSLYEPKNQNLGLEELRCMGKDVLSGIKVSEQQVCSLLCVQLSVFNPSALNFHMMHLAGIHAICPPKPPLHPHPQKKKKKNGITYRLPELYVTT